MNGVSALARDARAPAERAAMKLRRLGIPKISLRSSPKYRRPEPARRLKVWAGMGLSQSGAGWQPAADCQSASLGFGESGERAIDNRPQAASPPYIKRIV